MISEDEIKDKEIAELKAENERLYEEKNCLHKIIDRLLENAGYSKDIASAEDFEDVYENMQYKNNKLEEYKQTLQEIENVLSWIDSSNVWYNGQKAYMGDELIEFLKSRIINIINSTKAESEG